MALRATEPANHKGGAVLEYLMSGNHTIRRSSTMACHDYVTLVSVRYCINHVIA